jgi:hypothetical protein
MLYKIQALILRYRQGDTKAYFYLGEKLKFPERRLSTAEVVNEAFSRDSSVNERRKYIEESEP